MTATTVTISILTLEQTSAVSSTGKPYTKLTVNYKDVVRNEVKSKLLMPFGAGAGAYKTLSDSKTGDVFVIEQVKNDKGYLDWLKATQQAPGAASAPSAAPTASAGSKAATTSGSSYPTNEERAATQRSIIRQSCLKAAVDSFAQLKNPVETDVVLKRAQEYVDFINEKLQSKQLDLFNTPNDDFDDVPV